MISLHGLPPELVVRIFEELVAVRGPDSDDESNFNSMQEASNQDGEEPKESYDLKVGRAHCWLSRVAQVNRQFYQIALPLLYSNFNNLDPYERVMDSTAQWIRTILEDDGKACLVRRVDAYLLGDEYFESDMDDLDAGGSIENAEIDEGEVMDVQDGSQCEGDSETKGNSAQGGSSKEEPANDLEAEDNNRDMSDGRDEGDDSDEGNDASSAGNGKSLLSSITRAARDRVDLMLARVRENSPEVYKRSENVDWRIFPSMAIAVAIVTLPNLRVLRLVDVEPAAWEDIQYVASGLASYAAANNINVEPLASIETVILGCQQHEKYPESTTPLAIVASWPNVQTIIGHGIADGDNDADPDITAEFLSLQPKSSSLKTIRLTRDCKLLGEHLVRFVGTAKALETFEYQVGHAWGWIPIKTAEISRALSQHEHSLKEIKIRHESHEVIYPEYDDHEWKSMDFSRFQALTHLEISFGMFFGYHNVKDTSRPSDVREHALKALPSSLERLSVLQCVHKGAVDSTMDAFAAIAHCKFEKHPRLRELKIETAAPEVAQYVAKFVSTPVWANGGDLQFVVENKASELD